MTTTNTATLTLHAVVATAGGVTIAKISEKQSRDFLPSRGQVFVRGTINGKDFQKVLEPDGYWSHWFRLDKELLSGLGVHSGDTVKLEVVVSKDWPEPEIPADFAAGLAKAPQKVQQKWQDITAMARWEWIRWVNATANSNTRVIRIEKSISKLNGTHRRPCCFNLAACTDPELSKGGRLLAN